MNNFIFFDQVAMGKRIKEIRKQSRMTNERFAEIMMVSDQAVYKWQRGDSAPDIQKLMQISELFHVTTDYLIKGTRGDNDELSPLDVCWMFNLIKVLYNV